MNSIFLRIYGGMLAAMVLVAVLATLSLHWLNEHRSQQYRERLAHGTMTLMADNLAPMDAIERQRALALWGRLLGIPLSIEPLEGAGLDSGQRNQVLQGMALVTPTGPHAVQVYRRIGQQALMLTGEVQQISEQLARATIYLLADELMRFPINEQPQRLAQLKQDKGFGFEVRLMTPERADMDTDQRRRVDEGDTVMALGRDGDSIRVFAGIARTPWVLEIGPLYQMNPYPPQLLVLIAALGLCLVGLIVYLLVRRLERRLSVLESAATHIAQGNLDTRVPSGEGGSVGRLAAAFNGMAEHLQRSLNMQRELVRAVSHELRTPVARLRFGLEMLGSARSDEARHKYLMGMDGDIQDLDRLVDEMLTYARLEGDAPALDFQRVDLEALLDQVIAELSPLRPGVRVQRGSCVHASDDGAWVEAAPRYLHRAVQNLVSNALRHAESQVTLSFRIGLQRCRIDVEDDGPGVPETAWEKLFTPFTRLDDSRTRASGGHGLGLSIVRRIIHWHNGRVSISHGKQLGGACFTLVWPRRQEDA
ncbi:MAG: ATP-binding protein [Pseudomonas sp.]|uniref:ATP-binding protein n=1 Tax=Pseudomonas abieticivorans TaxID=2931382 RepID=UPI0020BD8F23|nr:ATP-binding protein [Pseudomonas sp. PIA16]MDE1168189.1 ATP-binding protein [Pseudomonas sp.]